VTIMQTFLPDPDFSASAAILDNRRLGKQRLEAHQILRTLRGLSSGWRHHPAVAMWRGYEDALGLYMNKMIDEWVRRGFKNTMERASPQEPAPMPSWLGDPSFHASHRANLLRKDPVHYTRFNWSEDPSLPYVWPVSDAGENTNLSSRQE
jgi:pyrimidine dimer DNA glycosylase